MLFAYALPPGAILVQGRAILDLHCFRAWAPYREKGDPHFGYVHPYISAYQPIFIHLALSAIQDTQYLHRPLKLYQPIYTNNREKSVLYKQGRESHASNQSGRFSRAIPDTQRTIQVDTSFEGG